MFIESILKRIIKHYVKKEIVPIENQIDSNRALYGKVALIAGGSGGIGFSIARKFLESGCKIIIAGTSLEKLTRSKQELNSEDVAILQLDYLHPELFEEKVAQAKDIFGKIDIFVSSSGVHTERVDFWNVSPSEYDRVMNINLKGAFFMCQSLGRYMQESCIKGNILLVSSSRGNEPAWSPYGISKWCLNGFTQGLAKMMTPLGITVNAIAPGSTATELIGIKDGDSIASEENKIGRLIMPFEIGTLAALLVSESGKMINGEVIHISGGRGLWDIR